MSRGPLRLAHEIHGSCVEFSGRGVLLMGASGSGKSTLALELVTRGAKLVGDDQIRLETDVDGRVMARSPAPDPGLIEARHVGIVRAPVAETAKVELVVDLDRDEPVRLPQVRHIDFGASSIRLIRGRNVPGLVPAIMLILGSGGSSKAG